MFQEKDFFKKKAGISPASRRPDPIKHTAALALDFQPFPIEKWEVKEISDDRIFDPIEFLYDHVSKPGEWVDKETDTGFQYYDYDSYDTEVGQLEFREVANSFLRNYKDGLKLSENGEIIEVGSQGLQCILDADIAPYNNENVDNKVRDAISKWRNRHSTLMDKKAANSAS